MIRAPPRSVWWYVDWGLPARFVFSMAPVETSGSGGGSVLETLLAPFRIPDRVIDMLESLAEAAREVGPMRAELTRVREQTEPVAGLMPALEQILEHTQRVPEILSVVERISRQTKLLPQLLSAVEGVEKSLGERIDSLQAVVTALEGKDSYLNETVGELAGDLRDLHETVAGIKGEVERLTERLPDPNRGPLEKARDALTSNNNRR